VLAGPHPRSLALGDGAPRAGRRRFSVLARPHSRSLALGDGAPRAGRRRFVL
jgi:hypothetical protein